MAKMLHLGPTCLAGDYDPSVHDWIWQRKINGTLIDVTANERTVFGSVQHVFSTFYSQNLTINQLSESDEGIYICSVVEASTGMILSNGAGNLSVNYPNQFPVCSPEGPAVIAEGDGLSCRTLIETRTPVVRTTDDPSGEKEDWVLLLQNVTQLGSELQKIVTVQDDGLEFFCFSTSYITRHKALSCTIGPLSVTPTVIQTPIPPLITACPCCTNPSLGIVGITFGLFVILASVSINLLCFRYDPRRLHHLLGCCSQSRTCNRQRDSNNSSGFHMDKRLYESSITGLKQDAPDTGKIPQRSRQHDQTDMNAEMSIESSKSKGIHASSISDITLKLGGIPIDTSGAAVASLHRSIEADNSTMVVPMTDPSYVWPNGQNDSSSKTKPGEAYIELNLAERSADEYTELKL